MQNHDSDVPGEALRPDFEAIEQEQADFRGSYGYGRRAYRPDPAAKYSFGGESRALPLSSQRVRK